MSFAAVVGVTATLRVRVTGTHTGWAGLVETVVPEPEPPLLRVLLEEASPLLEESEEDTPEPPLAVLSLLSPAPGSCGVLPPP